MPVSCAPRWQRAAGRRGRARPRSQYAPCCSSRDCIVCSRLTTFAPPHAATAAISASDNAVERWLGGARLYRDMIDVNVPTVYWVMAAPVWIAQRLGLPSTLVFNLFALALAALSTAAVLCLAARALPRESFVPDAAAGALLIWCAALVGHDFGQREHLATMLLAPYAIARAAGREVGSGVRILIGLCAGIGLALKPHFAFIVLGMEGALLLRRGRAWRPSVETAALAVWRRRLRGRDDPARARLYGPHPAARARDLSGLRVAARDA